MVNAEKYRDLIIEIFKTEGMNIGILNNTPYPCALLECREIEIALLIYEPHDFRKRVIELIKLAEVW